MKRIALAFLLGSLVGLFACVTIAPEQPVRAFRAIPLIPEAWYRLAYEEMEACLGKRGDFDAIEFYVVRDGRMKDYGGLWSWRDRIYIAEGQEMNGPLMKHEFGHHIVQAAHGPGFDAKLAACGALVQ